MISFLLFVAYAATGPSVSPTTAGAEVWSIETPHAPTTTWQAELAEGTWMSLDVSPDGSHIVFDLLGHLFEIPATGGQGRMLTVGRSWNQQPRYSPDGRYIAFCSDRNGKDAIWLLDRKSGEFRHVPTDDRIAVRPTWSADSRQLFGLTVDPFRNWSGIQVNHFGGTQDLVKGEGESYVNQFSEDAHQGRIFFESNDLSVPVNLGILPPKGMRIKFFDTKTGEVQVYIERLGGAFNPTVSRDGRWLAYLGRTDLTTTLFLRDLRTAEERVLVPNVSRDHQDNQDWYGKYPGISWNADSSKLYYWSGGKINAVDAQSGSVTLIPFSVSFRRELNETIRLPTEIASERATTRVHRWAQPTPDGILFEALGDLYLKGGSATRRLTDTAEHETSPVFDPATRKVFHTSWSDEAGGALVVRTLGTNRSSTLDRSPGPFGSLALAPDGKRIAYLRSPNEFRNNRRLQDIANFDLMIRDSDGAVTRVTQVNVGEPPLMTQELQRPPGLSFTPAGDRIWFTEQKSGVLELRSIATVGMDERLHYEFPDASRAVVSPDQEWIAVRQYHRTWLVPNDYIGRTLRIDLSKQPHKGVRLGQDDGTFVGWGTDSKSVYWTHGTSFLEHSLNEIIVKAGKARRTDISIDFAVDRPAGSIALRNVRAVTMNADREILENVTILIDGDRIRSVSADAPVPQGAQVFELDGHTVTPGFLDAHMHYGTSMSPLNVVEQRVPGLLSRLAYGVTTGYEVMGRLEKDVWLSDMILAGKVDGPRLFTVGEGIFGMDSLAGSLMRPAASYEEMREHVRYNKDLGATALKDYANFTRRARHQVATAAREVGINVVSESAAHFPMNMTQLIDGMTGLEHTMGQTPLYEDVLGLFSASKMGVTPTLGVVYNGHLGQTPYMERERLWENSKLLRFALVDDLLKTRRPVHYREDDRYAPEMARWMKALHDRGVPILVGGHGEMFGLDMHWELELMVEGGFTPLDALEAATIDGARHHGLDNFIGSIEPGKFADLIVLGRNPLDDIRNSLSIVYVIRNGVIYSGDDASRVHPGLRPARPMYYH